MMRKLIKYLQLGILITMMCSLISCERDFLDKPSKDQVEAEFFFNTAKDLEVATNNFYSILQTNTVYTDDAASDNIMPLSPNDRIRGNRIVPTDKGSGGWSWDNLRDINYFLENYHQVEDEEAKEHYGGVAHFFRAYFYFDKVKRFGDVPWYGRVLEADDEELYKPRDSRLLVMDSVMQDIDFAIHNLPTEKTLNRVSKYTALLLKARIALYEGTFRKYHGIDGSEPFLEAAVEAADELMESGAYTLFVDGGPTEAYRNLFARNDQDAVETILAAAYERGIHTHTQINQSMTSATYGAWGINKDLINSYLMKDGTRFTDKMDYQTMQYYEEFQNRDPRMAQTTAPPDFIVVGQSAPEPVSLGATTTGYRVIKALLDRDQWMTAYFDLILFRYAEALLIFAEAKAELGILEQADLDRSINLLRARVDMPPLDMNAANADPDPYQASHYPRVNGANKGVILEIRRERRIELFNEGQRWDDLMRWKEGKKLEHPIVGLYFPGVGSYDFTGDGKPDVYVYKGSSAGAPSSVTSTIDIQQRTLRDPSTGNGSANSGNIDPFPLGGSFDEERDYYYPIPLEDLNLNDNLKQNPKWK